MFLATVFNKIKYSLLGFYLNLFYMVYKTNYYKATEKAILELLELESQKYRIDEISKVIIELRITREFSLAKKERILNNFLNLEKEWRVAYSRR